MGVSLSFDGISLHFIKIFFKTLISLICQIDDWSLGRTPASKIYFAEYISVFFFPYCQFEFTIYLTRCPSFIYYIFMNKKETKEKIMMHFYIKSRNSIKTTCFQWCILISKWNWFLKLIFFLLKSIQILNIFLINYNTSIKYCLNYLFFSRLIYTFYLLIVYYTAII